MSIDWEIGNSLELRSAMIVDQLESRGIHDSKLLGAFMDIPRHLFVPHVSIEVAYTDQPLQIKSGQTISQPFIVAQMMSYLDIKSHHNVLEIGSGSGYATALLASLCKQVDAYEVYGNLIEDSSNSLKQLDIANVQLNHRSAWEQIDEEAVYDRIVLWASPPKIPEHLFKCLSNDGLLVAPEGKADQYVWIYKNHNGNLTRSRKDPVRFVPLVSGTVKEIDYKARG